MAEIIITSFFTNNGEPINSLTPSLRIWEVESVDQTLVIGAVEGTNDPGLPGGSNTIGPGPGNDATMVVLHDSTVGAVGGGAVGGSQDGFYKYTFHTANGYDPTKSYVFRVDGGVGQPVGERYQAGKIDITNNGDALIDAIYDEPRTDHLLTGSFGEAFNQDRADMSNTLLRLSDVEILIGLLTKFETNRTRIDGASNTMIIYDDDCVTPLRTFQLLDGSGVPSITEMCERRPVAAGTTDGLPTC